MIAIDTNILVYAHRSEAPENESARQAIERAAFDPRGWGIALASIAEFWTVVTHPPSVSGPPSSPKEARGFLSALLDGAGGRVWMPREAFWERLLDRAEELGVRGPRIFDLQIGVTALDNGADQIWTHDAGFLAPTGLRVHDPL
jgi:hypothetical protein